jgi:hypothetical protein
LSDKLDAIIKQKERLLKIGLAKAMQSYQMDNSIENLRRMQAAEKALAEIQANNPDSSGDPEGALAVKETELTAARDAALEAVQAKPTGANRKAYRKACRDLEEFLRARQEPDSAERIFSSILDVVHYLDQEGWKISKTTAYDHWKREGKIKARPQGGFTISAVQEYARLHLQRKDGASGNGDLQSQKVAAEVRRILSDAEMRELKLRTALGELMPKSQVEIELAERAGNLKTYFAAVFRSSAGRIIKIVKGDPQTAAELISFLLGLNKKAFDNYSRPIEGIEEEEE